MRIIVLCILISLANFNCAKNGVSSTQLGIWYSTYFGLVEIDENSLLHYPTMTPKESWTFDKTYDGYKYNGVFYKHCSMQSRNELFAKIGLNEQGNLIIKSDDGCFLKHSFGQEIILNRVPENIETSFSEISFSRKVDGKWKEVVYTLEELINIQSDNEKTLLTAEQQLWMIFNSGIDYSNTCMDNGIEDFITVKLKGDNNYSCKRINFVIVPSYLKTLFNQINSEFSNI